MENRWRTLLPSVKLQAHKWGSLAEQFIWMFSSSSFSTDKNYGMFQATLLPQRALHRAWSHRDSNSHKGSNVSRFVSLFSIHFTLLLYPWCSQCNACLLFHCDHHRWGHLQNWDLGKCSKGEPQLIVNHMHPDFLQINIRKPKTLLHSHFVWLVNFSLLSMSRTP